jgi:RimJ/RimL family protein N-acetyltransferase
MVDRESGALVGVIELGYAGEGIEGLSPDDIEVGWVVAAHAWGRRLATEGAAAVVADAFSQRGLERLFAYVRPANRPSIRVAEKLGMRHVRDGRARNGDPVRIYELAREPGV